MHTIMKIALSILSLVALAVSRGAAAQVSIRTTGLEAIKVALSKSAPVIRYYELSTGEKMTGESGDAKPVVRFCDTKEAKNHDSTENGARIDYDCRFTIGSVTYTAKLYWQGRHAADFALMYTVSGSQLNITCQLRHEVPGFQLLSVELPPALTVKAEDDGKLVIPTYSGRLVDIAGSDPMTHEITAASVNPIRAAMVMDKQALGILSVNSLDDQLFTSISTGDGKSGKVWMKFVRRPEAAAPQYQFLAQPASTCTVSILGKQGKNPPRWTDGAKFIRSRISGKANPLYTGSFIYKIMCDQAGSDDFTTFEQCLKLIKDIHALTSGAKQIAYLAGWQYKGHDTGYPDVFTVNERLGGLGALIDLIQQARNYNAVVSFHDNYEDAYEESPEWDLEDIAIDSDGQLLKGEVRAGGQSYILSPYRYGLGKGSERIKKTVDIYPVQDTYHIDVLSSEISRYDFNPKNPTGAQKNLEGKLKIIEQFRKLKLDVTSDELTSCFVGKISHFRHMQTETKGVFSSEEIIPLVPFIFHAKASSGGTIKTDEDLIRAHLYGITASEDFTKNTDRKRICDLYYLAALPWTKLADREMTDYKRDGDTQRIDYNKDTYVEVNIKKNVYKIVVDGSTIAQDFTATVPLDKKTIAVYSREGGDISFTAPKLWDVKRVKAYSLNADGTRTDETIIVEGRTLSLTTKLHVPYRVVAL